MTIERVSTPSVSDRSKFIQEIAEELDAEERHCVILRHIHGLTVGEIAEVLICSERLVESLLRGVERRLQERMQERLAMLECVSSSPVA